MKLKILCIGDIVGRPGRYILSQKLRDLFRERQIDCVIANAENAAGGSGLTSQIYDKLLKYGVHLVTLGDHASASGRSFLLWNPREISYAPPICRRMRPDTTMRSIKPPRDYVSASSV